LIEGKLLKAAGKNAVAADAKGCAAECAKDTTCQSFDFAAGQCTLATTSNDLTKNALVDSAVPTDAHGEQLCVAGMLLWFVYNFNPVHRWYCQCHLEGQNEHDPRRIRAAGDRCNQFESL
jgi:hypothetical protein